MKQQVDVVGSREPEQPSTRNAEKPRPYLLFYSSKHLEGELLITPTSITLKRTKEDWGPG